MTQTTFWRPKGDRIRLWIGEGGELLPISRSGRLVCPALWTSLCNPRLTSDFGRRCSPERLRRYDCQTDVATSHLGARSRAHCATSGSANFPPLLTRQQRDVTLTLQACNAKKISVGRAHARQAMFASGTVTSVRPPLYFAKARP